LDSALNAMSGPQNAALWTEEALQSRPEWENVRNLAQRVLKSFGWGEP
jgi:hypothetical protein